VEPLPIVLLPGLDGTGELFEPLVSSHPPHLIPLVIKLPHLAAYPDLFNAIRDQLPRTGTFAVLGDSFSGPLAVEIARRFPERVVGVILCNSFVSPPRTRLLRVAPWSWLFTIRPRLWAIRLFFLNRSASSALVSAVRAAIASTPRSVLAARMRAVFSLPGPEEQKPIECPCLSLCGRNDLLVRANERELRSILPRLTWVEIAAPHLLLQTVPTEAWAAISAFLSTTAGHLTL